MYKEPVNWQDEDGDWNEIDTDFKKVDGGYETASAAVTMRAEAHAPGESALELQGDDWKVGFRLEG
ncbi:MAG: hypothetical protein SGJ13_09550, partial [Actinomycetota bacterium]|nr:hypothetical protein [Actinomycetota bacterium]